MTLVKKISLAVLIIGYLVAGINHFVHPTGYISIIPYYIPFPKLMNVLAGGLEVLFALLLIRARTRPFAAIGIILMLIAFLPVHVEMVVKAPFKLGTLTVTPLIAWIRMILQFVLMLWVGWYMEGRAIRRASSADRFADRNPA